MQYSHGGMQARAATATGIIISNGGHHIFNGLKSNDVALRKRSLGQLQRHQMAASIRWLLKKAIAMTRGVIFHRRRQSKT